MKTKQIKNLRRGDLFTFGGGRGFCEYRGNGWYVDEYGQKLRLDGFRPGKNVFVAE